MSIDRPDLAAAFAGRKAPVDRAAGLSGLLPPPKPRPSTSPSTSTSAEEAGERPPSEVAAPATSAPAVPASVRPAGRKESGRPVRALTPSPAPVSESAETVASVAVYLEPELLDQARQHIRARQITYDELVVDAFAAVPEHQLQQVLAPRRGTSPLGGMPTRTRRPRGTAGFQINLRLTGPQRTWLEQKQQTLGAPTRSALVATALALYLTD